MRTALPPRRLGEGEFSQHHRHCICSWQRGKGLLREQLEFHHDKVERGVRSQYVSPHPDSGVGGGNPLTSMAITEGVGGTIDVDRLAAWHRARGNAGIHRTVPGTAAFTPSDTLSVFLLHSLRPQAVAGDRDGLKRATEQSLALQPATRTQQPPASALLQRCGGHSLPLVSKRTQ
ncbi:hypothetical protein AAFF_G00341090 [Aldrovandia affinis]|uniref:Uncharacterized protein n=1 Tax=Aldrovandia affinis TaxID=143900 RepID=A0AAD7WP77_9TELE|nr:hypothetical protein AAFF_G00341090 [Aldrovandia affinis]